MRGLFLVLTGVTASLDIFYLNHSVPDLNRLEHNVLSALLILFNLSNYVFPPYEIQVKKGDFILEVDQILILFFIIITHGSLSGVIWDDSGERCKKCSNNLETLKIY